MYFETDFKVFKMYFQYLNTIFLYFNHRQKGSATMCNRVNVTLSGALSIRQDSINRQHTLIKKKKTVS